MAYNPMMYLPQGYQPYQVGPAAPMSQPSWSYNLQQTTAQPVNGLVSVTGIEGAKAYQLPPNSSMPLFDADADVLYVKTTDAGGFPTVRAFRFEPVEDPIEVVPVSPDYVTREDFQALMEKVDALASSAPRSTRTRKVADDGE